MIVAGFFVFLGAINPFAAMEMDPRRFSTGFDVVLYIAKWATCSICLIALGCALNHARNRVALAGLGRAGAPNGRRSAKR